ncbi:MAG: FAD/NAD(P)-binding protein [Deltaproteobacteria bacterium]|nr:FAD/NAD(P)-binding protein [Deltaproteobacteria bacterium]
MKYPRSSDTIYDVAIIGAGFSGVAVAYHLARRAAQHSQSLSCLVFEPRERIGAGVAYQTQSSAHILNVPAGRMSVDESDPQSFLRWLINNGHAYSENDFVPRPLYQAYLSEIFNELKNDSPDFSLEVIAEHASALEHDESAYEVKNAAGASHRARNVILAVGNSPASGEADIDSSLKSPWDQSAIDSCASDSKVAVIGSGLSAVDTILALEAASFKGHYTLISRRGLLPQPHGTHGHIETTTQTAADLVSARPTIAEMLHEFRGAIEQGVAWRDLIDALRPSTQKIWNRLPSRSKRSFIRHLRPFWDSHRHRVPVESLSVLLDLKQNGRLTSIKGRVLSHAKSSAGVTLTVQTRGRASTTRFDSVFDCRGLWTDLRASRCSLLDSIIRSGTAHYDELALGLRTDKNGKLLSAKGTPLAIYTLGSLRRGELWETTAVREIRTQARLIAESILPEQQPQRKVGNS